jgi:hypothetical protein
MILIETWLNWWSDACMDCGGFTQLMEDMQWKMSSAQLLEIVIGVLL